MRIYRFKWDTDFLILEKISKESYGTHSEGYILIDKDKKDEVIEELREESREQNSFDYNYRGCTFKVIEDEEIIQRELEKLKKSLQAEIELNIKRHASVSTELSKMKMK